MAMIATIETRESAKVVYGHSRHTYAVIRIDAHNYINGIRGARIGRAYQAWFNGKKVYTGSRTYATLAVIRAEGIRP